MELKYVTVAPFSLSEFSIASTFGANETEVVQIAILQGFKILGAVGLCSECSKR